MNNQKRMGKDKEGVIFPIAPSLSEMEKSDYTVLARRVEKQSAVYRGNRERVGIADDIVVKMPQPVAQLE